MPMSFESLEFFAFQIPQFDIAVTTSSGNRLAIGTKGYATDATFMPPEGLKFFAIKIP